MTQKQLRHRTWIGGPAVLAGALLVSVLLVTPGDAAPGSSSAVSVLTTLAVEKAMGTSMAGPFLPRGPVFIPRKPTPRSPYQPPSWVPGPPPWAPGRPPWVPSRPPWAW